MNARLGPSAIPLRSRQYYSDRTSCKSKKPGRVRSMLVRTCGVALCAWLAIAAGWFVWQRFAADSSAVDYLAQGAMVPDQQATPHTKSIELIQVGERVGGTNPIRQEVEIVEPDRETWREIRLHMRKGSGLLLRISLLRPLKWLEETHAQVGRTISISMPEMGAAGEAEVTYVGSCPPIMSGFGPVVTGKFIHQADESSNVVRLRLEGQREETTVTASHRYWSAERSDYVEVGQFRVGEFVDTTFGLRRVESISPHFAFEGLLYNVETTEHVYRVGSIGTLVHNSCLNRGGSFADLDARKVAGEVAHHMPQNAAGVVSRGKGPALGMTTADHELTRTMRWKGAITNRAESELTAMQRLNRDIADIRKLFGNKYDKGIRELRKYARSLPEFQ